MGLGAHYFIESGERDIMSWEGRIFAMKYFSKHIHCSYSARIFSFCGK